MTGSADDRNGIEGDVVSLAAFCLPLVVREARKLSAGDDFLMEDLTQEGFLAAMNAQSAYDPARGNAAGYIRICARNRMISYLRRNRQESPMEAERLSACVQDSSQEQTAFAPAGGQQERIEIREALMQLLGRLSPFEQDVLSAYLKGGGIAGAASLLGCERKRIDNALQRIRNKARSDRAVWNEQEVCHEENL